MGADTTSTQLIFFIAATVVATAASAALSGVVFDLTGKLGEKGDQLSGVLATDIRIINDPATVPNNPVLIYVKNTGTYTLNATLTTLLIDGTVVTTTNTIVGAAAGYDVWKTGDVLKMSYATTLTTSADHLARAITQNGVADDLRFRVG